MSDWDTLDIGRCVTLESGARPQGGVTFDSGDIPSLGGENVLLSGGIQYEPVKRVSINYYRQMTKGILQNKDVLINKDGANTGKVGLYLSSHYPRACINEHLFILRSNPEKLSQEYLYYLLLSNIGQKKIKDRISGSAQPGLGRTFLNGFLTPVPSSFAEQRAIADILTTVDDAIEQTEALIHKYQRIKQGLMQDLLTRGVDENGELRQYDPINFQNTPIGIFPKNWRVGTLNDFAINLDSKRVPLKQEDREKIKGEYPYYGASGVIDWINDYIFDGEYILIGEDGENVISRNLPLAFKASGKFWVNNHAHVYKPLCEINMSFLVELLESVDYSKYISGSAQPKLTQNILSKIPLPVPPYEEQQRIGIIIDMINNLMLFEKKTLIKLSSLKFGLMQDLLTGKVRVNL